MCTNKVGAPDLTENVLFFLRAMCFLRLIFLIIVPRVNEIQNELFSIYILGLGQHPYQKEEGPIKRTDDPA